MIDFRGRAILTDVEGTTSSIRFVYEVLFPYARRELANFLRTHAGDSAVHTVCEQIAPGATIDVIVAEVHRLMDGDAKVTPLKELQGLIWREGYAAGKLQSHVYPDVRPALESWLARDLDVRIYSSGSIAAQIAFFAHTAAGDLLPFFRGHYDTTIGPKRDPESYRQIVADLKLPAADVLFLSDIAAELDAARIAGMVTAALVRPGNAPLPADLSHPTIASFAEISVG